MIGCVSPGNSETEALRAIEAKAEAVTLSHNDTPQTIQSVGELLYVIDTVTGTK